MKIPIATFSAALVVCAACFGLWGCPNPNDIGVQTFGYVAVTCVQASNNQPVSGAIATVDGNTQAAGSNGVAIVKAAIGSNIPASCEAPGLSGSTTIPSLTATSTQSSPFPITIPMSPS
jgi:hypothetical protein